MTRITLAAALLLASVGCADAPAESDEALWIAAEYSQDLRGPLADYSEDSETLWIADEYDLGASSEDGAQRDDIAEAPEHDFEGVWKGRLVDDRNQERLVVIDLHDLGRGIAGTVHIDAQTIDIRGQANADLLSADEADDRDFVEVDMELMETASSPDDTDEVYVELVLHANAFAGTLRR